MAFEAQIQSVALFFYLVLFDEEKSITAASKVLQKLKQASEQRDLVEPSQLIFLMNEVLGRSKKSKKIVISMEPAKRWILPEGCDLGQWQAFAKKSELEELSVLVWSQILGYSEGAIARGLGVSEGTVRYRLARALLNLGEQIKGV